MPHTEGHAPPPTTIIAGVLLKKGGGNALIAALGRRWRPRHFELRSDGILRWRTSSVSSLRGALLLDDATLTVVKHPKYEQHFTLTTPERVVAMRAPSQSSLQAWFSAFETLVATGAVANCTVDATVADADEPAFTASPLQVALAAARQFRDSTADGPTVIVSDSIASPPRVALSTRQMFTASVTAPPPEPNLLREAQLLATQPLHCLDDIGSHRNGAGGTVVVVTFAGTPLDRGDGGYVGEQMENARAEQRETAQRAPSQADTFNAINTVAAAAPIEEMVVLDHGAVPAAADTGSMSVAIDTTGASSGAPYSMAAIDDAPHEARRRCSKARPATIAPDPLPGHRKHSGSGALTPVSLRATPPPQQRERKSVGSPSNHSFSSVSPIITPSNAGGTTATTTTISSLLEMLRRSSPQLGQAAAAAAAISATGSGSGAHPRSPPRSAVSRLAEGIPSVSVTATPLQPLRTAAACCDSVPLSAAPINVTAAAAAPPAPGSSLVSEVDAATSSVQVTDPPVAPYILDTVAAAPPAVSASEPQASPPSSTPSSASAFSPRRSVNAVLLWGLPPNCAAPLQAAAPLSSPTPATAVVGAELLPSPLPAVSNLPGVAATGASPVVPDSFVTHTLAPDSVASPLLPSEQHAQPLSPTAQHQPMTQPAERKDSSVQPEEPQLPVVAPGCPRFEDQQGTVAVTARAPPHTLLSDTLDAVDANVMDYHALTERLFSQVQQQQQHRRQQSASEELFTVGDPVGSDSHAVSEPMVPLEKPLQLPIDTIVTLVSDAATYEGGSDSVIGTGNTQRGSHCSSSGSSADTPDESDSVNTSTIIVRSSTIGIIDAIIRQRGRSLGRRAAPLSSPSGGALSAGLPAPSEATSRLLCEATLMDQQSTASSSSPASFSGSVGFGHGVGNNHPRSSYNAELAASVASLLAEVTRELAPELSTRTLLASSTTSTTAEPTPLPAAATTTGAALLLSPKDLIDSVSSVLAGIVSTASASSTTLPLPPPLAADSDDLLIASIANPFDTAPPSPLTGRIDEAADAAAVDVEFRLSPTLLPPFRGGKAVPDALAAADAPLTLHTEGGIRVHSALHHPPTQPCVVLPSASATAAIAAAMSMRSSGAHHAAAVTIIEFEEADWGEEAGSPTPPSQQHSRPRVQSAATATPAHVSRGVKQPVLRGDEVLPSAAATPSERRQRGAAKQITDARGATPLSVGGAARWRR